MNAENNCSLQPQLIVINRRNKEHNLLGGG